MSKPFPPVQRYLGWLQRFLYQVETGQVPPVIPTVQINQDWPQQVEFRRFTYTSIIGTVTTVVYQPPEGKHGLVFLSEGGEITGGNLAVGDTVAMDVSRNLSPFARVFILRSNTATVQWSDWPFIGAVCVSRGPGGAPPIMLRGADPVYVGPGCTLRVTHTAAIAGGNYFVQAGLIELPQFMPLRLP